MGELYDICLDHVLFFVDLFVDRILILRTQILIKPLENVLLYDSFSRLPFLERTTQILAN